MTMNRLQATAALFLFSFLLLNTYAQQISPANYTPMQANTVIQNATNYVNLINQSSYLIFGPDLGKAYAYLAQARLIAASNPIGAVIDAELAYYSAEQAYAKISILRQKAFIIITAFALLMAIIMYDLMKPIKISQNKTKRGVR